MTNEGRQDAVLIALVASSATCCTSWQMPMR